MSSSINAPAANAILAEASTQGAFGADATFSVFELVVSLGVSAGAFVSGFGLQRMNKSYWYKQCVTRDGSNLMILLSIDRKQAIW